MRYRTIDGNDYSLPNIGRTVNGAIETDKVIENPLFELVEYMPTQPPASDTNAAPTNTSFANGVQTPPVEQPTPPAAIPPAQVPPAPQVNEQKE